VGPLLLLAVGVGCGSGEGTVSGRVLYQNTPVPGGLVTFTPVDARHPPATAVIDEHGRYQLTVAAGEVQISVDNRELKPLSPRDKKPPVLPPGVQLPPPGKVEVPPPQAAEKPPGKYREIPEKYLRADLSGLSYTVTSGTQSYDVELK
jgi:hypothetical protein